MDNRDSMAGQRIFDGRVLPEWIDANAHMNVAYYVLAFDLAIDAIWSNIGINEAYLAAARGSTFAVETHVIYRKELLENDPYFVTADILAFDDKRLHQFLRLYHAKDGYLAATAEWMNLHVSLQTRRVSPWPDDVLEKIAKIAGDQPAKSMPADVGKIMRIQKPVFTLPHHQQSSKP